MIARIAEAVKRALLVELSARIDKVHSDLIVRIDELRREVIELITNTRAELTHRQDAFSTPNG